MNTSSTADSAFTIPAPAGRVLGRLPAWPGSALFAAGLNLVLRPQLPADVTEALNGRRLRIHVRDAALSFEFTWRGGAFAPLAASRDVPDLTIAAHAADFWALARREVDPDTLFFGRRLSMEGDTELGLIVKNTLDAMELPVFDALRLRPPSPRDLLDRLLARARGNE